MVIKYFQIFLNFSSGLKSILNKRIILEHLLGEVLCKSSSIVT
jgi:hypothetical protein